MATKPTIFFWNQTPGRSPLTLPPSWALLPGLGIKGLGYTALIMASQQGKVEVVEALLAAGADREAKESYVRAPPLPP